MAEREYRLVAYHSIIWPDGPEGDPVVTHWHAEDMDDDDEHA